MDESFSRKYKKVLEILPDVTACANGKLILAGGTALALFHLKHRISVDLDFIPVAGNEKKLKEELKGCLSKKGYRTAPAVFKNQFVVQFEDTSIKVEVFVPDHKIKKVQKFVYGGAEMTVASLDDLFQMKLATYADRQEARDLFDIFSILKKNGAGFGTLKKLLSTSGSPGNLEDIDAMATNPDDAAEFRKVITDASS